MTISDTIAISGVMVSICLATWSVHRATVTSSASIFISLSDTINGAYREFLTCSVQPDDLVYRLGELMNKLELACALYADNALVGRSKELLRDYLDSLLSSLVKSEAACDAVDSLLQTPDTFKYVRKYLQIRIRFLSVTVPARWYETV